MKSFLLMLSFFTRLPVKCEAYEEKIYIKGIRYVPIIGLLIGLILYGISFLSLVLDRPVVSLLLILCYVILTGALHLDGLADTCDGIFSGRERGRILEIMKDSQTGVYGVIAIGFWLVFYAVMLNYIPYEALILMPVVGKAAPILSANRADYIRQEGLGKIFAQNCKGVPLIMAFVVPVIVCLLTNPYFLIAVAVAFLCVQLITNRLDKLIGGITGDTMGYVCEISQMVFLFSVYIIMLLL